MKYRVLGVDEESGETLELTLEAASEAEARASAERRGLTVGTVVPAASRPRAVIEEGHEPGAPVVNVALPRRGSSLGLASLVLGVLAFLFCWVPVLNLLGVPLSGLGLLLGLVGVVVALRRRGAGVGFPIAGSAICGVALAVAIGMNAMIVGGLSAVGKGIQAAEEQRRATNQTTAGGEGQPGAAATEWVSAEAPVRQGDVQVRVTSVRVGKVRVPALIGGEVQESKDVQLVVSLEVSNTGDSRKVDYRTWGDDTLTFGERVGLADDLGNHYRLVTFGLGERPEGGVRSVSLYPGKSTGDVLVFEPPLDKAQHLDLELPAENFGGTGMLRLRIPRAMIGR